MRFAPIFLLPLLIAVCRAAGDGPTTEPSRDAIEVSHPSPEQRRQVNELSRRALAFIDHRRFADAERALRRAIEIIPDSSTCLFNLACVHAAMGEPDAAMDDLERATDAGFTDFTHLQSDPVFSAVRELPRWRELMDRRGRIVHQAALRIVAELRDSFGDDCLYDADERHKLIFAARLDRHRLDRVRADLELQAADQRELLFAHPSDEFIRIVIASPADFARLENRPGVGGEYDDTIRTILVHATGPELRHEFTHAIHAADQHALGQVHPVWLSEGLATLYETPTIETDAAGRPVHFLPADTWRLGKVQAAARDSDLISLPDLLTMRRDEFTARADLAYGEAGSLLMYCFAHHLLGSFYRRYTAEQAADPTGRAALQEVTGMTLPALQKAWFQWMLSRPVPSRQSADAPQ